MRGKQHQRCSSTCNACRGVHAGVCRVAPRCGSGSLVGPRGLRLETKPPVVFHARVRAGYPLRYLRSFFERCLCCRVSIGMFRAHREPAKSQLGQICIDRTLMESDAELRLKAPRKIHAPPTHDTISRRIGPGLNPTRELRHLVFRQEGLHPTTRTVGQSLDTFGIVTRGSARSGLKSVHRTDFLAPFTPVPKGLTTHSAAFSRDLSRRPLKHQGDGQKPPRYAPVLHAPRLSAQTRRRRVIACNPHRHSNLHIGWND